MGFWNGKEEGTTTTSAPAGQTHKTHEHASAAAKPQAQTTAAPSKPAEPAATSTHPPAAQGSKQKTEVNEIEAELLGRYGQLQSALSFGTKVEGKLTFDKPVRIDGELRGEVKAPGALVVVGPQGIVDAKIEALFLVIMGEVKGSLKAVEKIELLSGGKISGEIETPKLVMQDGSIFNGNCRMSAAVEDKKQDASSKGQKAKSSEGQASTGLH